VQSDDRIEVRSAIQAPPAQGFVPVTKIDPSFMIHARDGRPVTVEYANGKGGDVKKKIFATVSAMHPQKRSSRSRRQMIASAASALAATAAAPLLRSSTAAAAATASNPNEPFGYCLNTSTISGQNLGIESEVDLAAKVGYQAIEPWVRELETFEQKHGSLKDLRKRIQDSGLKVPDAIGFAHWIVDDEAERAQGMEQAKRDMDKVAQIGGTHMAAPPIGANDRPGPDLPTIARRYGALLELGDKMGVTPMVELWGASTTLSKLGEAAYVALEAHHPKSCMLLDIYHLYKGGSDFDSLRLLSGHGLPVIHTNDYPATPPRATINDSHRVYPGDGIAPLDQIFRTLRDIDFRGYLSVELFNRSYWKQSPLKVAKAALEKTKAAVQRAMQY
jgi:2-keto-myo-inositol isomerase